MICVNWKPQAVNVQFNLSLWNFNENDRDEYRDKELRADQIADTRASILSLWIYSFVSTLWEQAVYRFCIHSTSLLSVRNLTTSRARDRLFWLHFTIVHVHNRHTTVFLRLLGWWMSNVVPPTRQFNVIITTVKSCCIVNYQSSKIFVRNRTQYVLFKWKRSVTVEPRLPQLIVFRTIGLMERLAW